MPKKKKYRLPSKDYKIILTVMQSINPTLFSVDDPIPLMTGVHEQMKAELPDLTNKQARAFLAAWCGRPAYLKAIVSESTRFNLDGTRAVLITEEHKEVAKARLVMLAERKAEKDRRREERKKKKLLTATKQTA